MAGNSNRVPLFVKSKKPEQLIILMHNINMKHGKEFDFDIIFDGKEWFAWYKSDIITEAKRQKMRRK